MDKITVVFKRHSDTAILPKKMTQSASCMDVYSDEDIELLPNSISRVKTGISAEMPKDCEIQIRPRSGLSMKGIIAVFGTIDADFIMPFEVIIMNVFSTSYFIKKGDRIAQIKISTEVPFTALDEHGNLLQNKNDVRQGGFGSTKYE